MNKKLRKAIISAAMATLLTVNAVPLAAYADAPANDRIVYTFLTERLGLNHAAASGLMSNIYKESGFLPTVSCTDTNGKTSYGIMQWNGSRFEQLQSFCRENGYAYDTLEGQLAYLEYDLTGVYRGYYDHLLYGIEDSEQGAYDAAYFWASQYEVCSSKYFELRAELARDFYYPEFMNTAPVDLSTLDDSDSQLLPEAPEGFHTEYSPAPSVTVFRWNKAERADTYRVRIFKGSSAEGAPFMAGDKLTGTEYKACLPAGTYSAVVDSVNQYGMTVSNAVTFTVTQQTAADLGESFIGKISWNDGLRQLTAAETSTVQHKAPTYEKEQLWNFTREDDGSYSITAYESGDALATQNGSALLSEAEENSSFMIYGSKETGYFIQPKTDSRSALAISEEERITVQGFNGEEVQQFDIDEYEFNTPEITVIADGGEKEPVLFTWDKADCAEGYILSVTDEDGCMVASVKVQENDVSADVMLKAGKYKVGLTAVSEITGESADSDEVDFEVMNLPERPKPELTLSKEPGLVGFQWERCEDADRYSYRITEKSTGKTVKYKNGVKGCADKVKLTAGEYILTVSAENENGSVTSEEIPIVLHVGKDGEAVLTVKSVLASVKMGIINAEEKVK